MYAGFLQKQLLVRNAVIFFSCNLARALLARLRRAASGLCYVLLCLSLSLAPASQDEAVLERTMQKLYGSSGLEALQAWRAVLHAAMALPEAQKLARVNNFFNRRLRFQTDDITWQQIDYWATPIESLGRGAADCEDYVIAKYFSLLELGVPAQRLRLTYVRARIGLASSGISQAHMVLSYYSQVDAEPLVLDNLLSDILPAAKRPDLTPVFGFNGDGIWAAGATRPNASVDRLSRWKDLLLRMRSEGYGS